MSFNILFLGAPWAGKTVFFTTILERFKQERKPAQHDLPLWEKAIKKMAGAWIPPAVRLSPNDVRCKIYVDTTLKLMEQGKWPTRTKDIELHNVKARITQYNKPEYQLIQLMDCDGHVYLRAFEDPNAHVDPESNEAKLRELVAYADALCLIVDPQALHPDAEDLNLQMAFLGALTHASIEKANLKVAIVFTKSDLYDKLPADKWRSPELLVEELAPIDWHKLPEKRKAYFRVCCVRSEIDDLTGRPRPPKNWSAEHAEGVDKVIWWLMDDSAVISLPPHVTEWFKQTKGWLLEKEKDFNKTIESWIDKSKIWIEKNF